MPEGVTPTASPGAPPAAETIYVDEPSVACDGGNGALGHPRVWLRIVHEQTTCPYCSRIFKLTGDGAHGVDH